MKSPSKTTVKSHIGSALYPILYTLILFLVSAGIYFYANGYRFDIFKNEVTQSGVINIESSPLAADVYVNDKLVGKTPKSTSVKIGNYHITVKKDGYYNWEKDVDIVEGKSTPTFPWLVKQNPKSTTLWTSTGTIEKYWTNEEKNHLLFLTKEEVGYTLWEYTLNPSLWDFTTNPSEILKLDNNNVEVLVSPDGIQALITIIGATANQYYIVNTQTLSQLTSLKPLSIDSTKGYAISWSQDNAYLMLDSATGIYSYDLKLNQTTILAEKVSSLKHVWATDKQGFFYIVELSQNQKDDLLTYDLKQISLNGTNPKYIINNFYFYKSNQYINQYRKEGFTYSEFTSSPECTFAAGEISYINVNQKAQGVFIQTSLATYWFNIQTQKFIMISAYPVDFIALNTNYERLIFQDTNKFGIFTFDKTEGDHTVSIGSKTIKNIANISQTSNMSWVSDSLYLTYLQDGIIYITDIDGENKSYISKPDNLLIFLIRDSKNTLLTFTKDEANKLSITELGIH